jgi:hypothetical protein
MTPMHTPISLFFNVHFNIIFSSKPKTCLQILRSKFVLQFISPFHEITEDIMCAFVSVISVTFITTVDSRMVISSRKQ